MRKFLVQRIKRMNMPARRYFDKKIVYKHAGTIEIPDNSSPQILMKKIANQFEPGLFQILSFKKTKTFLKKHHSKNAVRQFNKVAVLDLRENGRGNFIYLRESVFKPKPKIINFSKY